MKHIKPTKTGKTRVFFFPFEKCVSLNIEFLKYYPIGKVSYVPFYRNNSFPALLHGAGGVFPYICFPDYPNVVGKHRQL